MKLSLAAEVLGALGPVSNIAWNSCGESAFFTWEQTKPRNIAWNSCAEEAVAQLPKIRSLLKGRPRNLSKPIPVSAGPAIRGASSNRC